MKEKEYYNEDANDENGFKKNYNKNLIICPYCNKTKINKLSLICYECEEKTGINHDDLQREKFAKLKENEKEDKMAVNAKNMIINKELMQKIIIKIFTNKWEWQNLENRDKNFDKEIIFNESMNDIDYNIELVNQWITVKKGDKEMFWFNILEEVIEYEDQFYFQDDLKHQNPINEWVYKTIQVDSEEGRTIQTDELEEYDLDSAQRMLNTFKYKIVLKENNYTKEDYFLYEHTFNEAIEREKNKIIGTFKNIKNEWIPIEVKNEVVKKGKKKVEKVNDSSKVDLFIYDQSNEQPIDLDVNKNGSVIVLLKDLFSVSEWVLNIERCGFVAKDFFRFKISDKSLTFDDSDKKYVPDCKYGIWFVKEKGNWTFNKPNNKAYLRPEYDSSVKGYIELFKTHSNPGDTIKTNGNKNIEKIIKWMKENYKEIE